MGARKYMGHGDVLSEAEFLLSMVDPEIKKYLAKYQLDTGKPSDAIKVLDWGCGRGCDVLHLLKEGYTAYGVDTEIDTIKRGESLFRTMGYNIEDLTEVIDFFGKTKFPDNYFDFIYSYTVLEHVENLAQTLGEIARITKPSGAGVHIFPGRFRIFEGHLHMPFVHWLPKNRLRRGWIHLLTTIGIEPKWESLKGKPAKDRTEAYYKYTVDKTFYRTRKAIMKSFRNHGFDCEDMALLHDRLQKSMLSKIDYLPFHNFIDYFIANVTSSVLYVRKRENG